MSPPRGPGWRDEAAAALLARHLPFLDVEGPVLVMGDPRDEAAHTLVELGVEVDRWSRRATGGRPASPWPPEGPYGTAAVRLPPARDELEMTLHAAVSVLRPGGRLLVYGAKDEGIGSTGARMEALVGRVSVAATGGRCRVLAATRPEAAAGLRGDLGAWKETSTLPLPELARPWVSYPGVFAHGHLDAGSLFLATSLPAPPPGSRVLDFGCGSGVLGALVLERQPGSSVDFLDVDAVALEAVRENVPGARRILSDGLMAVAGERWDRIVSNPPIHAGKAETVEPLAALVTDAPAHLTEGGELFLVAQRRLPVQRWLEASFPSVQVTGDDGRLYRTWRARNARSPGRVPPDPLAGRPPRR